MFGLLAARSRFNHSQPAGGGGGDDPFGSSVVSLLRLNGSEGSTSYPDEVSDDWTGTGNAHITTADSKFGGGSLRLDGSGDYLAHNKTSAALAGLDSFTVELWARSLAQPSDPANFLSFNTSTGVNSVLFQDGALYVEPTGNIFTYPKLPLDGLWHHMALVCDAGTYKVFQDGVLQGSAVNAHRISAGDRCSLGQEWDNGTPSGYFNGYFNEVRVTRAARYTGNFTPPTAPFPAPSLAEAQSIDFETDAGGFMGDWAPTTAWASVGTKSLGSGNKGINSSTSATVLQVKLSAPKTLTLDWHVQSESGYDKLTLTVNGVVKVNAVSSSAGTGGTVTVALPAGTVTIYAFYTKDGSSSTGLDQAFIDNIQFT